MIVYNGIELGPIMESDALVLQALIKATTPKVLVEFGHFWGESARKMLEVMTSEAKLYSYDNTKNSSIENDDRFIFRRESQEDVKGIENIDFVFLDASHELELNKKTFIAIEPHLNEKAIVAVHDTGSWYKGNVFEIEYGHADKKGGWVHCPGEVDFVNWVKEEYPEYQQIHLHSSNEIRHGITLLQKYVKL